MDDRQLAIELAERWLDALEQLELRPEPAPRDDPPTLNMHSNLRAHAYLGVQSASALLRTWDSAGDAKEDVRRMLRVFERIEGILASTGTQVPPAILNSVMDEYRNVRYPQ